MFRLGVITLLLASCAPPSSVVNAPSVQASSEKAQDPAQAAAAPHVAASSKETAPQGPRCLNLPPPIPVATEPIDASTWYVPVSQADPIRGPSDALVTVVVFGGYQCPFTARLLRTLGPLLERYGDDLRIVWKNRTLPFHPEGLPSALFGQSVFEKKRGQAFWQVFDQLLSSWDKLDTTLYETLAQQQGLSYKELTLHNSSAKTKFLANEVLARNLNVSTTPQLFINGVHLMGAQPIEIISSVIDERLAVARDLAQSGVPREQIYEHLLSHAGHRDLPAPIPLPPFAGPAPVLGPTDPCVRLIWMGDATSIVTAHERPVIEAALRRHPDLAIEWRQPHISNEHALYLAAVGRELFVQRGSAAYFSYQKQLLAWLLDSERGYSSVDQSEALELAAELGADQVQVDAALADGHHAQAIRSESDAVRHANLPSNVYMLGPRPLTVVDEPNLEWLIQLAKRQVKPSAHP